MATAKNRGIRGGRSWPKWLLLALLVGGALFWYYRVTIRETALAGTSYGAHNACSCRFIAGREMGSCKRDFIPGMEAVFLSEDADDKSVTAYVPLIASTTATYREGFGCVLEPWED